MNAIQAVKDYFIVPETGMLNGKRMNLLIMTVSAVASAAICSLMTEEYLTEGEVSCLGSKCINLISIAALESGTRGILLSFHQKSSRGGIIKELIKLPGAAMTVIGIQLFVAKSIHQFQSLNDSAEETSLEGMEFVLSLFGGGILTVVGGNSLFANHWFRWVGATPGEIEY